MAAVPNYAERRAFGRRPANLTGYVYLPGKAGITCMIVDISEGGALLEFSARMVLPPRLRLMREGSDLIADCEVRHARGVQAGVQFLTEAGRQMARDVFKLNAADTAPPLAPAPKREIEVSPSRGTELVQRMRVQRQQPVAQAPLAQPQKLASPVTATAGIEAPDVDAPAMDAPLIDTQIIDVVPRDILSAFENALRLPSAASVPRPLPPHKYAVAYVPLPLPAYTYALAAPDAPPPPRPLAAHLYA